MRIWILIVIVILLGGAVGAQADDLQVLKSRILDPLQNARVDTDQVQRLITAQQPEGSWPSIDYSDSTRSGWKLNQHLYNLTKLTLAYRSDRSPLQGQPELRRAVHAALNDWLQHDYQNPNWWHNVIGVPRSLSSLFLLLQSELDSVQLSKGIEILKRAELGMTGQNLVWVAGVTINRGILQNDLALVDSAFARIESEIRITTAEGIQPDFSFHQHGNCLYNHGYGSGFAVDVSRLAALAAGTRFEFSAEKINILTRYILDGSAWMIYGRTADYGALGREITRPGENAGYLRNAAENLLQLDTGREEELQRLINRITYPDTANIFGNKHFWRSDFMTHHRPDYYASVRMYSTRMDNTDNPYNSEGLKSHHIADGCNFRFVSGNEYKNIFPLWDWRRIPGTTVIQFDSLQGNVRRSGRSDFVGGVSDGTYGLAAFDFKYDSLAARKSWFFFDRQYVCLGAGISSNTNEPVYTTVDQCYLNGEVSISKESVQTPSRGEHRIKGPVMIRHASAEYIFPEYSELILHNTFESGSWYEINRSKPAELLSDELFTLCIDHGAQPRNAEYAYIVRPNSNPELQPIPDVRILANHSRLQAVFHPEREIWQCVFYVPGALSVGGFELRMNHPGLLMLQKDENGLQVCVSDPTQMLEKLIVSLSGQWTGPGCRYEAGQGITHVEFTLPPGGAAGQSVKRSLFSKK